MAATPLSLRFLGAARTVTGSRTLVEYGDQRLLVDCGLFQGWKELRERNWAPFPVEPETIDAVVLTHAHIDHSGYLPRLLDQGFEGPAWCTRATRDLCSVLLPDAGRIHEKDAEYANRKRFSRHDPALPLYDEAAGEQAVERLRTVEFGKEQTVGDDVVLRYRHAGHILGAASAELRLGGRRIVFSGDLGRPDDPLMFDPNPVPEAEVLVVESTYGDRSHGGASAEDALAEVIQRTVARGGTVLIPAFAVGRTQLLLYYIHRLQVEGRIPKVSVAMDSPMAIDATEIFRRNLHDHRLDHEACHDVCAAARVVRDAEDSKRLDHRGEPQVLISASGMATGGRVLHHLKCFGPDPDSTILFAGFQAPGTRGERMIAGAESVRIHGEDVPIRAEVSVLDMLSAHADGDEILAWLGGFERAPSLTLVNHGEPEAAETLCGRIRDELGWEARVPEHDERFEL